MVSKVESKLEMAQRHVREGELRVSRQRAILEKLRDDRHPTRVAEQLLEGFETILKEHKIHLARIIKERH